MNLVDLIFFAPGSNYTFIFKSNGYKENVRSIVVPNEASHVSKSVEILLEKL